MKIYKPSQIAFSPCDIEGAELICLGTASGTMDASFSNNSSVELYPTSYDQSKPFSNVGTKLEFEEKISALDWTTNNSNGIIALGSDTGCVSFWNVENILTNSSMEQCQLETFKQHKDAVNGLAFNKVEPRLLATGSVNGDIQIWDLNQLSSPYSPTEKPSMKLTTVTNINWNHKVGHIFSVSSGQGNAVIFDLKNKREVMSLGRPIGDEHGLSSVIWNPSLATQLCTAFRVDTNPVIEVWDLRNAKQPQVTLSGHSKGILSLDWSLHDNSLLISCGRDCEAIVWDTHSNFEIGRKRITDNWMFNVKFSRKTPGMFAMSSFDSTVNIGHLTSAFVMHNEAAIKKASYVEDPFAMPTQQSSDLVSNESVFIPISKAPAWLARPCAATFGFDNSLFVITKGFSEIKMFKPDVDAIGQDLVQSYSDLSEVLKSEESAINFVNQQIELYRNDTNMYAIWSVIRAMSSENSRTDLLAVLNLFSSTTDIVAKFKSLGLSNEVSVKLQSHMTKSNNSNEATQIGNEDDFFDNPTIKEPNQISAKSNSIKNRDLGEKMKIQSLSTNLASCSSDQSTSIYVQALLEAIKDTDTQLEPPLLEAIITDSLLKGEFENAITACVHHNLVSDALLIANCSGKNLIASTLNKIFESSTQKRPSYWMLIRAIQRSDFTQIVRGADTECWCDLLLLLLTYADQNQLEEGASLLATSLLQNNKDYSIDSCLPSIICYCIASDLDALTGLLLKVDAMFAADFESREFAVYQLVSSLKVSAGYGSWSSPSSLANPEDSNASKFALLNYRLVLKLYWASQKEIATLFVDALKSDTDEHKAWNDKCKWLKSILSNVKLQKNNNSLNRQQPERNFQYQNQAYKSPSVQTSYGSGSFNYTNSPANLMPSAPPINQTQSSNQSYQTKSTTSGWNDPPKNTFSRPKPFTPPQPSFQSTSNLPFQPQQNQPTRPIAPPTSAAPPTSMYANRPKPTMQKSPPISNPNVGFNRPSMNQLMSQHERPIVGQNNSPGFSRPQPNPLQMRPQPTPPQQQQSVRPFPSQQQINRPPTQNQPPRPQSSQQMNRPLSPPQLINRPISPQQMNRPQTISQNMPLQQNRPPQQRPMSSQVLPQQMQNQTNRPFSPPQHNQINRPSSPQKPSENSQSRPFNPQQSNEGIKSNRPINQVPNENIQNRPFNPQQPSENTQNRPFNPQQSSDNIQLNRPINPHQPPMQNRPLSPQNRPMERPNPNQMPNSGLVGNQGSTQMPSRPQTQGRPSPLPSPRPPMQGRPGLMQGRPGMHGRPMPQQQMSRPGMPGTPLSPQNSSTSSPMPPFDPSAISVECKPIYEALSEFTNKVKDVQGRPPQQTKMVMDMHKKICLLFSLMATGKINSKIVGPLKDLVDALERKDKNKAFQIHQFLTANFFDSIGPWMVGLKLLINLA